MPFKYHVSSLSTFPFFFNLLTFMISLSLFYSKKVLSAKDINGIKSTLQNFPNFKEMSLKEEVEERGKDSDDDEMMENNEEEDGEGPLVEIMKNEKYLYFFHFNAFYF